MDRVVVYGNGGSGKSTLASRVAGHLGADHVEIDELAHDQGYVSVGPALVRERVAAAISAQRWVVEGINRDALATALAAADTFVWLDLSRARAGARLLRRAIVLTLRRRERHGQHISARSLFTQQGPFIVKTLRKHGRRREYAQRFAELAGSKGLTVVRLRSPAEVRRWISAVERVPRAGVT